VEVHAVEVDEKRAQKVVESLDRGRLQARIWVGDASQSEHWRLLSGPSDKDKSKTPPAKYHAILLDAPCSASGIVRRHPDIRWLRRAEDISRLFETQAKLLNHLWSQLHEDGVLLYCTCSVFKDEGERQINSFLKHNSDAIKLPSPGHLIPQKTANDATLLDNQASDQDGFYYALLQKNPLA
jgi:16S rRNA (cytosine967-C5)-methyltransferase